MSVQLKGVSDATVGVESAAPGVKDQPSPTKHIKKQDCFAEEQVKSHLKHHDIEEKQDE